MQRHVVVLATLLTLLIVSATTFATPEPQPDNNGLAAQVDELTLEVDELQDLALETTSDVAVAREVTSNVEKKLNDTIGSTIDKIRAMEIDDDEDDLRLGEVVGRVDVLETALAAPAVRTQGHFLAIDGIDGESQDGDHPDEIEVLSWSWGATQTGTGATGGGGSAGKASVSDLSITKKVDKSSPTLFLRCAQGEHIPEVVLTTKQGNRTDYLIITLTDVLVSSYQSGGSGQELTESVSFQYAKIEIEYVPQNSDGSPGTPIVASYDAVESTAT